MKSLVWVGGGWWWRDDHTVNKVKSFFSLLTFDFSLWLFLYLTWLSLDNFNLFSTSLFSCDMVDQYIFCVWLIHVQCMNSSLFAIITRRESMVSSGRWVDLTFFYLIFLFFFFFFLFLFLFCLFFSSRESWEVSKKV